MHKSSRPGARGQEWSDTSYFWCGVAQNMFCSPWVSILWVGGPVGSSLELFWPNGCTSAPFLPDDPGLLHLEVRLQTSVLYRSELTRGGVQAGWLSYTAALPYLSSSEPPACNGCSKAWLQGCAARRFAPVVKGGEAAGMGALFLKDSPQTLLFEGKKPLKWLCHAVGILLTR